MTAALALAALVLTGCDTIHGVRRQAPVHCVPDMQRLKAQLESYPEVKQVELCHDGGGVLITITGIHDGDEVFTLVYGDREDIHGVLQFTRDHKGKVLYSQSILRLNHPPLQSCIDATWPVMKRIERDLAEELGLPELRGAVEVEVFGDVQDPDRSTHGLEP